jgi:hypothetical protein
MNIYDKIVERLQQSVDRPSIQKFFKYSIEELQDNPDRLKEIADYLSLHEGKYQDFELLTWIDEETFKPVFMLRLYLGEEYAAHIIRTREAKVIQYFQNQNQENNQTL